MSVNVKSPDVQQDKSLLEKIGQIILDLISDIPPSSEPPGDDKDDRAKKIVLKASATAAVVSGGLALPPGPLGLATVLPDILGIWRIQRQMVADIAAVYGKTEQLGKEEMLYCLFKHLSSQALRDIVVRVGERFLVRRTSLRAIQKMLRRIGVKITQRIAGRGVSRWVPIAGVVGIGAYAFYDTAQVGKSAIDFFESEINSEGSGS